MTLEQDKHDAMKAIRRVHGHTDVSLEEVYAAIEEILADTYEILEGLEQDIRNKG